MCVQNNLHTESDCRHSPGSLGVEEEDEEVRVAFVVVRLQHVLGRRRDRHVVVEVPGLRHLRVNDLQ